LSTPILKNKLHIPTIHQNIVSCPRLIQRLDSGIKEESHAIRIAKDSGVPLLSINGIETATANLVDIEHSGNSSSEKNEVRKVKNKANLQFYHQLINQSQSTRRRK